MNNLPLTKSDIQSHCSKCSIQLRELEFGATVAVHICISNAAACQLKTITIQTSIANTAVNLRKLPLKKHLNMAQHPQLRRPRNHATFGKIFKTNKQTLRKIYNEIVHWKPNFFTISKNKVGFKIADVMNIILTRTLEDGPQTECAMICKTIMPHLLLARSKTEMMLQ